MLQCTVFKHSDLTKLNASVNRFKETVGAENLDQVLHAQPLPGCEDQHHEVQVWYDDGRKSVRWTTGGDSIK